MVHHTPSKARARSMPVFFHPCWSILGVLCDQYGYDPIALVACTMANQPHPWTHWWIERGVKTYRCGWSSWYITHHPRQRMKVPQFSFIHTWYILCILCGQYGCDPLDWLPVQWCINLIHAYIDEFRGVSTHVCMVGSHSTSHTIQEGLSKKCASFHPSTHGIISLEYCVASMYVIPLCCCLYNGVSTSPMNIMMNW